MPKVMMLLVLIPIVMVCVFMCFRCRGCNPPPLPFLQDNLVIMRVRIKPLPPFCTIWVPLVGLLGPQKCHFGPLCTFNR